MIEQNIYEMENAKIELSSINDSRVNAVKIIT
jgi:hypothetical protein